MNIFGAFFYSVDHFQLEHKNLCYVGKYCNYLMYNVRTCFVVSHIVLNMVLHLSYAMQRYFILLGDFTRIFVVILYKNVLGIIRSPEANHHYFYLESINPF